MARHLRIWSVKMNVSFSESNGTRVSLSTLRTFRMVARPTRPISTTSKRLGEPAKSVIDNGSLSVCSLVCLLATKSRISHFIQ